MAESTTPEEFWRVIPSHPTYEASSLGRIRSNKFGKTRILSLYTNRLGYERISMDGVGVSIHRAVAESWQGPCPEGMEVDHINHVRNDNRAENLRYLTKQENLSRRVVELITECSKGHALEDHNLYVKPDGRRACRECATQMIRDRRTNSGHPCTIEECQRCAYIRLGTSTAVCEMHYQRERKAAKRERQMARRSA